MIAIDLYFFMNAAYDLTLLCEVGIVARKRLYFVRVPSLAEPDSGGFPRISRNPSSKKEIV